MLANSILDEVGGGKTRPPEGRCTKQQDGDWGLVTNTTVLGIHEIVDPWKWSSILW